MTNRIDRLVAHGLVERLPGPRRPPRGPRAAHRRRSHPVDAAMEDLLRAERDLLADLADEDERRLADLLRVVVAPFDA